MYRYLAVLCVNEECAQRHCNRLANNDHPLVLLDARVPVSHCSTSDATGASPEPGTGLSSDSGWSQEPVLVFGQPLIREDRGLYEQSGLEESKGDGTLALPRCPCLQDRERRDLRVFERIL